MSQCTTAHHQESAHFSVLHDFPPSEWEKRWRTFLGRADSPSAYNTPEFFLEPFWEGKRPFAILASKRREVTGVLTGIHLRDRVISGIPFRPQLCFLADDVAATTGALLEGLLTETGSTKLIELYSWQSAPLPIFEQNRFRKKQLEGDVVIDLSLGAEALFKQFHDSRKNNIRTAMRKGIEISEVKSEKDLSEFWEVFCGWRESKRKQIQADVAFAEIKRTHELSANHRRFLARYQGRPVAASSFRFCPKGLFEYAGNCSLDEFTRFCPNDLLLWKAMEWACDQGFSKCSMGAAHPFLRKFGGMVEPICRYRWDRTFLQRHELKENLRSFPRAVLQALPAPLQQLARASLKH